MGYPYEGSGRGFESRPRRQCRGSLVVERYIHLNPYPSFFCGPIGLGYL